MEIWKGTGTPKMGRITASCLRSENIKTNMDRDSKIRKNVASFITEFEAPNKNETYRQTPGLCELRPHPGGCFVIYMQLLIS